MNQKERIELFKSQVEERILFLDGGMGTMIQSYNLSEEQYRGDAFAHHSADLKGNNDLINITQPAIVEEIQNIFLDAGADILETNTFNANGISQQDYKLEHRAYEINLEGAKIARKVANERTIATPNKPRFVAGALGPTNRTASISPDVNNAAFRNISFKQLSDAYYIASKGLIDGGVDFLLIETVFDTLNCKAAIFAVRRLLEEYDLEEMPLVISGTITDLSGRTLSGQTVEAFWNSIRHAEPFAIGLNCALGGEEMRPHIEELSKIADTRIIAYPNAGLPNEMGEYEELPEKTASFLKEWAEAGFLNIAGGCCGITPAHVRAIYLATKGIKPRTIPEIEKKMRLSGLEPLNL